jgi:imidazolonepropionase-like amidohydrolase
MLRRRIYIVIVLIFTCTLGHSVRAQNPEPNHAIVLNAARLLDVVNGKILKPGEVLIQGNRILEVGTTVKHPAGAEIIDLGDRTLLPGLIDAHIHLFLHPGHEDL